MAVQELLGHVRLPTLLHQTHLEVILEAEGHLTQQSQRGQHLADEVQAFACGLVVVGVVFVNTVVVDTVFVGVDVVEFMAAKLQEGVVVVVPVQ